MKLKTFDASNTPTRTMTNRQASVTLTFKSGLFAFSKGACDLIGLKHDTQIVIHQDEDMLHQFYIEKVKKNGFELRHKNEANPHPLMMNNSALVQEMISTIEMPPGINSCKILIDTDMRTINACGLYLADMTESLLKGGK